MIYIIFLSLRIYAPICSLFINHFMVVEQTRLLRKEEDFKTFVPATMDESFQAYILNCNIKYKAY